MTLRELFEDKRPMCNVVCEMHKNGEHFLTYYSYCSDEIVQKEVDTLNSEKPDKLFNGLPIDWEKIEYFYVSKQRAMGD